MLKLSVKSSEKIKKISKKFTFLMIFAIYMGEYFKNALFFYTFKGGVNMAQQENVLSSELEAEYITTKTTLTILAKKYGLSYGLVRDWSKRNDWVRKRKEYVETVKVESLKRIQESVIDKKARLHTDNLDMVDKLQKLLSKKLDSMASMNIESVKEGNLLSMARSVATLNALTVDNTNAESYDSIEKLDSLIKTIKEM